MGGSKLKLIESIKTHISRSESDKSLCGQAPWSRPVEYKDGSIEDVTCERCLKAEGKLS